MHPISVIGTRPAKITFNGNFAHLPLVTGEPAVILLYYQMDKSELFETLLSSEKNKTIVAIKVINRHKPLIGAVQKVLNQIIILQSASDQQVLLTFADIESVTRSQLTPFWNFYQIVSKTLHCYLKSPSGKR